MIEDKTGYILIGLLLSAYIVYKLICTILWFNFHPLRIWRLGFMGTSSERESFFQEHIDIKEYFATKKRRMPFFLFIDRFSVIIFVANFYLTYMIFDYIKGIFPGFFQELLELTYNNVLWSAIFIIVICIGMPVLIPLLMSKLIFQFDLFLRKKIKKEIASEELRKEAAEEE